MIATPVPAGLKKPVTPAVLPSNNDIQTTERPKANPPAATPPAVPQVVPKQAGYGLPCANCKTYYAADLKACPVCKAAERVSPSAAPVRSSMLTNEVCPDPIALEEERERFLREFKSQVFASQVPTSGNGSMRCIHDENHLSGAEPAAVCQGCYDHMQERVDVLEFHQNL